MSGALAVGVAACAVAALALVGVLLLWQRVRKLRSAQAVVLGYESTIPVTMVESTLSAGGVREGGAP